MQKHPTDPDFAHLSLDERTLLAHKLRQSVHDEIESNPVSPEQWDIIERRVADVDAGGVSFIPWEDMKLRPAQRK